MIPHGYGSRCILAVLMLLIGSDAGAQGPSLEPESPSGVRLPSSSLGAMPGDSGIGQDGEAPADQPFLGGRPGVASPRVPLGVTMPGPAPTGQPDLGIGAPTVLPLTDVPVYGTLGLPTAVEDEGPADGLTLDRAIEGFVRGNLDLRAKAFEISQAQADILTAGLRANPIFYADAQLVPYGSFDEDRRPGGQTQYDINITHPFDVSGKRKARVQVAAQAKRVIEAQFQDYVRLQIDNLYRAFVDVLAARETVRFARASVEGLDEYVRVTDELLKVGGVRTRADLNRVRIQRDAAEIGFRDAEELYLRSKRNLATLLNFPPGGEQSLDVRGSIRPNLPAPPTAEQLVPLALSTRPDLIAFRLGLRRATADVRLQRANRFADVYVLAQPYTFQNNEPLGLKSAHSWALGVTVPLPIYNRNQGNIARAQLNVTQTQIELANQERAVVTEVTNAEREYAITRYAIERIEQDLIPSAVQVLADTERLYRGGEVDVVALLVARQNYNEVARQYRDTAVRHRRSMLTLNTVMGQRIMP